MTTISQLRPLDRPAPARRTDLATASLRHLRTALASFTAHVPHRTSAGAPARDIALRAHRPGAGPSLTESQRFRLPR